jgi:23S rRNA G2445 N2-methylase RlmL
VFLCEIAPERRNCLLRKPAFASVSLDNNPSSSKRHRKHKQQDEPAEEEHLSKKERKKRMVERAKVQLNEMTTEERQELYHYVQTQKWLNKKVEFDGEKVITCAAMHLVS